jgi:hypothetical protein
MKTNNQIKVLGLEEIGQSGKEDIRGGKSISIQTIWCCHSIPAPTFQL